MYTIHQSGNVIEFSNKVSPGVRVLIFLFGLVPLLAPYELLIKIKWESYFNLPFAISLFIALGATAVSLFLFFFALMSMNQRLRFDGDRRVLTYGYNTAILPFMAKDHPFRKITALAVEVNDWGDGPTTYDLRLQVEGERKITFGNFEKRDDADRYHRVLKNLISTGTLSE
jgi:hypothetical protein